ncbi:MAG TPA: acyl-homoserine-lactone synthase [Steroidobacteraceae bacterium]|nr:acyl-homoserine-lactone synthase [Steroidobacteraceae bacterium]
MIFVVDAGNRRHFVADLLAMHRQRKAVFVDGAGWKVPVVADQEIDRFDLLEDTVYLLAKDEPNGPVLASARLLRTTAPHLMEDLYPASHRAAFPAGPTVWEVSRFCTAPGIGGRGKRLQLLWETICGVMEAALAHGIDQVIFAANRALLPLALECGWEARAVAPTMSDGDDEVTAVAAAVTAAGLRNVRMRYGVPNPIIRHRVSPEVAPVLPRIALPAHTSAP